VLDLSSTELDSFSTQDEQLLVMIASHLAGLIENVRLNDETRKRAENLSLIHQVVQKVVGLTETPVITQIAAGLMAEQFDYDFVGILLVNEQETELILNGIAGQVDSNGSLRKNFSLAGGVLGEVLRTGQSRVIEDMLFGGNSHPITGSDHGTEMCVLLQEGERYLGVIDVIRNDPYTFTENDLVTLEALAGVLSSVIMNANRYQQLQMSVRQLEAARETALEIAGDLDLDILLRRIVRRAREMVGARGAELALVDEHAEIVRTVVSDNPWRDFTGSEVPFMSGVEGKVAVLGEPVVVEDYNNWPGRLYPERHMPYRTVAGIPLTLTGQVIGVLLVSDDRPGHTFRPADLQLLEFFAAQAAIFVRNARLYQEIQERMEAQRQAEMQLVRSARLAAVGEMAAGVAHELNNPLTTVAGFIELVLDELPESASQRQDLELVLREARRARGVVRRLLDFSRPGDNLRIGTDVNELVSEVLTLVQHLVRTNGVTLSVQLQEDLVWAAIDPNQIKQVLLNLVHNALQAMPRGGVLVVRTENQERDDTPWLAVSVRDNGMGIAPDDLERIFEPFFTTRPVGSGTGLGLSVSYGIITEHGGFIDVESEPGHGSCFTVWLPVESNV
jgi:two-component system, NtrC family, sensor kinase